jgi:pyrroline-5-carboxylate reductase
MGGALARAWRSSWRVLAFDPAAGPIDGVERVEDLGTIDVRGIDVLVIAVKPAAVRGILAGVRPFAEAGTTIVSIAAGVGLATLTEGLGAGASVVRAMPNTAAAIGKGVTAAVAGDLYASARSTVEDLFGLTGGFVWLGNEGQLHVATAISGSGPAYFFRFVEAMARAGAALGLDPDTAARLTRQTLVGAGALADADARDIADLRAEVTSPGGTTAAAIAALEHDDAIDSIVMAAATAAARRSAELGAQPSSA